MGSLNFERYDLKESIMAKSKSTPMTRQRAAAIQSSQAKQNGGGVSKNSFPARATRAANKNSK